MNFPITIVYDKANMLVGCANVQASLGGNPWAIHLFPTKYWSTTTSQMIRYRINNQDEMDRLLDLTRSFHRNRAMEKRR